MKVELNGHNLLIEKDRESSTATLNVAVAAKWKLKEVKAELEVSMADLTKSCKKVKTSKPMLRRAHTMVRRFEGEKVEVLSS